MATPDDPHSRIFEVAERQSGYFTASQALEAGYSYASQHYHHKVGNWVRDGWGIYRLAHFPRTAHEELVRLMLWSRDRAGDRQAVVSHDTALEIYAMNDVMPAQIHLTVPRGFRKNAPRGVVLHYSDLEASEIDERDGYRITTPLRTLLDTADSSRSPDLLEAATKEALRRGLVRRSTLVDALRHAPEALQKRFAYLGLP